MVPRGSVAGVGLAGLVAVVLAGGSGCKKETIVAPTLGVTCQAQPASGPAPLAVTFLLSVSGAEGTYRVSISYGDGQSGTSPDLPHTYVGAGAYTASFEVSSDTQSARCATAVTVTSAPTPSPVVNLPPSPVYKSTPDAVGGVISGPAPLSVRFNMCASTDPEGDLLYFLYDFEGDGHFDAGGTTGANCRKDHVYATAGSYKPRLCLHDMGPDGEALHPDQCRTFTVNAS
jgi:PKD repeat protein